MLIYTVRCLSGNNKKYHARNVKSFKDKTTAQYVLDNLNRVLEKFDRAEEYLCQDLTNQMLNSKSDFFVVPATPHLLKESLAESLYQAGDQKAEEDLIFFPDMKYFLEVSNVE